MRLIRSKYYAEVFHVGWSWVIPLKGLRIKRRLFIMLLIREFKSYQLPLLFILWTLTLSENSGKIKITGKITPCQKHGQKSVLFQ